LLTAVSTDFLKNMRSNKPLRINRLLRKSAVARLLSRARTYSELDAELHALIPAPLNSHCRILSIRDDTLVLAADSPVWAARLRFHTTQLVKQLSTSRTVTVRTVSVRVRPRESRPSVRPAGRQLPIPGKHAQTLRQVAREVTDPGLRAALLKLAGHHDEPDQS